MARALLLLVGVFIVYLSNPHVVESTDTVGNELLPISLLEQHNLWFDQYYTTPGSIPAQFEYRVRSDSPTRDLPWWFQRVQDHVVSLYPIVPGLLNTPVYLIASWLGVPLGENVLTLTHITTAGIAALSVLCMYLCLRQVGTERAAVFLSLNFAFATAVWSNTSQSLFQHGPSLLFITVALAALLSGRPRLIALAGLMVGMAVFNRPTNSLVAAALTLYVLRFHRSAFAPYAVLATVPIALMAWYSQVYWGTPFSLGQGQSGAAFAHGEPLQGLLGLLVSPNRGLLVFSPIFVFSLVLGVYVLRQRVGPPILPYVIWSSAALYVLYAFWPDWHGGHTYGYRYLIETIPALMLVLGACWDRIVAPRPVMRGAFLLAALASMYVHGLGALTAPCGFDDEPNNVDYHHERLWDIADGEIARCTQLRLADLSQTRLRMTSAT